MQQFIPHLKRLKDAVKRRLIQDQKGQSFFEFIMLILILVSMSFIMIRGINGGVGDRWKSLVSIVAEPTDSEIELR